jgi:hypothetical protein
MPKTREESWARSRNRTGTDGRPIIPKKTSVTGRHDWPVRLQNAWLFSCCVSFFKNGWPSSHYRRLPRVGDFLPQYLVYVLEYLVR